MKRGLASFAVAATIMIAGFATKNLLDYAVDNELVTLLEVASWAARICLFISLWAFVYCFTRFAGIGDDQ